MRRHLRQNVVAYVALFVALSGGSYAAAAQLLLPKNSVASPQVINGSLQKVDLSRRAIAALHGQRGAKGATGPTGPQGTTGAAGPTGPQGIQGLSGNGSNGVFHGSGDQPALWGIIDTASNATAVIEGDAPGQNIVGVRGYGSTGVRGSGNGYGVAGDATFWGVQGFGGSLGVLSSSDLGVEGHFYAHTAGKIAGVCQVPAAQSSVTCSFGSSFGLNTNPIVVVTPTTNPGSAYWVAAADRNGFTLNLAVAPVGSIDFNFLVVGLSDCPFPGNSC